MLSMHCVGLRSLACARGFLLLSLILGQLGSLLVSGATDEAASVKKLFADPPRQYSSAPLWVWNDWLTEDQIVSTMRDLASQKVKQVFVHPRPGLMTPYLSAAWFRLWKVALREARRLDMNVWIYDENSYPSGFAGGWVPEVMPESRGRGLSFREGTKPPPWTHDLIAVFRLADQEAQNISNQIRSGEKLPEGKYLTASVVRSGNSPWHGGRSYVDLLYPGVTEKFLAITMEPYRRMIGSEFGKRVPGVFTDEPELRPAGGLPWTEDLPQAFEKRWGYRLTDQLAGLRLPVGDWEKVRHNYYQTLLDLFIERWAKPYHDYCATNRLEFTGHYWDHEWPNCTAVPDNMAMYAWHQRPAIDILMNQYQEDTHAQFGNVRSVKELSSVANQLGYRRTLCEAYGAGGWDLRFEDMKRIGDWLYVLGVNTLDQHLSYITLRGARKRDHPQSFSYHEPWWEAYHVSAEYFSRLSAALSSGEQVNPVLVLEPTTTAWLHQGDAAGDPRLDNLGKTFFQLLLELESTQVEYDLGCEDIMARHGSVAKGALVVGQRRYSLVVLPSQVENLNSKTVALLENFLKQGGVVLAGGDPPARVDGAISDRGGRLAQAGRWRQVNPETLVAEISKQLPGDGFGIRRNPGDPGLLFHHRRQLKDGQLVFLANTSLDRASSGFVESAVSGAEEWNLYSGKSKPCAFEKTQSGCRVAFDLPPGGSRLLWLSKKAIQPLVKTAETAVRIPALAAPQIRRVGPNVLVLDHLDVTAGGETLTNAYYYRAGQLAFQKNGLPRNPWDSAVQFRDEFISLKFPANSGFTATYRFVIQGTVPAGLMVVVERPDLYAIECNGKPVKARKGQWWLDKAFGKIDLASAAQPGENTLTLKATPFTVFHEIEAVYVLGEFSLKPVEKGFVIEADKGLALGRWNEQGQPFLSAGVIYEEQFEVNKPSGRYSVSLPSWYGSVGKVTVNGRLAGYVTQQPWDCEVTPWIKRGVNAIQVQVIGTLKNTLGPHHGSPGLGSAWPAMFQKGPDKGLPPGSQYATVGYGLFEPFVLQGSAPY